MDFRRYVKFVGMSFAVAVVLVLVGFFPTRNLAGATGLVGMVAACGLSLLGSWLGAVPTTMVAAGDRPAVATAALGAMAIRFVVVLFGALAVVLGTPVERPPFLIWVGISYLVLLLVDTLVVVRIGQSKDAE